MLGCPRFSAVAEATLSPPNSSNLRPGEKLEMGAGWDVVMVVFPVLCRGCVTRLGATFLRTGHVRTNAIGLDATYWTTAPVRSCGTDAGNRKSPVGHALQIGGIYGRTPASARLVPAVWV